MPNTRVNLFDAREGSFWVEKVIRCVYCRGTGRIKDIQSVQHMGVCKSCQGTGKSTKMVSLSSAMLELKHSE
jgi:DnaJ-class molecular chaperone